MRVWLCVVALVVSACVKSDQAKHSEIATSILQQHGTPDFADASTAEYAAIQHTPSGMVCVMPAAGAFEFDLFPASSVNAGAQCSSTEGEVVTGWVVVKFREATTLDAAFASAIGELTQGLDTQPWEGRPSEADRASPTGLPHYRIHRLIAQLNGEERYLRISMSEMDGWYFQQIASAPVVGATDAEAKVGIAWRAALNSFAEARRASAGAS